MSSTKQEGTSAAAEQVGSMSLDVSAERKVESGTNGDAENGTPTKKKFCSWCGKKSDTVKKCTACKCVWYCDKECQNKHRKEHKKECKPIKKELDKRGGKLDVGTEKDIGPLPDLHPREECPICMRVLPIHENLHIYFACCGKTICAGCNSQHRRRCAEKTCAFCREPTSDEDDEELLAQFRKRVELKDPIALVNLAMYYGRGLYGLPVDQAKCFDLLRQSADLGFPGAHYKLGLYHYHGEMGLEENEEEAHKYFKEAAEGGYLISRHNLACMEYNNGDRVAAMRHWRLSASGGYKKSMGDLIGCFEDGLLHHGDLAEVLQVMYRSRAEMKSEDLDRYIEYLKKAGDYEAEYDM